MPTIATKFAVFHSMSDEDLNNKPENAFIGICNEDVATFLKARGLERDDVRIFWEC